MRDVAHGGKAIGIGGIVADTVLEALVGREIHVARIGHLGAIDEETVLEHVVTVVGEGDAPHALLVLLHRQRLRVDFGLQQHFPGIGCLHAEGDAFGAEVG